MSDDHLLRGELEEKMGLSGNTSSEKNLESASGNLRMGS